MTSRAQLARARRVKTFDEAFADFNADWGHAVINSLYQQSQYFRRQMAECLRAYDAIRRDPQARARQDRSRVPTDSLPQMAQAFGEEAERAMAAARDYERLQARMPRM